MYFSRAETRRWAHPRSRGDHPQKRGMAGNALGSSPLALGSSPLARGPQRFEIVEVYGGGLIPARAGTTIVGRLVAGVHWAHPRSRGDHGPEGAPLVNRPGSSPLARGPHPFRKLLLPSGGLIPARAGTTIILEDFFMAHGAHPRSRGDHS